MKEEVILTMSKKDTFKISLLKRTGCTNKYMEIVSI